MVRSATLSLLALCVSCLSAPAVAADQKPQFLFVQSAKSVSFADGVLTLENVAPLTVFFSGRPQRVAGHMKTASFVSHWTKGDNSFKKDPPNATLSVFNPDAQVTEAVVELTNPQLKNGSMSFDAKVLSGKMPANGGEASLFIDGSDGGCWAGDSSSGGEPCWARAAFAGTDN